jgi:hypothetical protein
MPIVFKSFGGREFKLVITVGYDHEFRAREVFCADFKAGSDNQAIVMDACILLSRLLQHGNLPEELFASMSSPPSLIGSICKALCEEQHATNQESTGFAKRAPHASSDDEIRPNQ